MALCWSCADADQRKACLCLCVLSLLLLLGLCILLLLSLCRWCQLYANFRAVYGDSWEHWLKLHSLGCMQCSEHI